MRLSVGALVSIVVELRSKVNNPAPIPCVIKQSSVLQVILWSLRVLRGCPSIIANSSVHDTFILSS